MRLLSVIAVMILLSGCSVRDNDPYEGWSKGPVFFTEATADGQPLNLTAGLDSIYHFTGYYFESSTNKTVCYGAFANEYCPDADCAGSLVFEFRTESYLNTSTPKEPRLDGEINFMATPSNNEYVVKGTFSTNGDLPSNRLIVWKLGESNYEQSQTTSSSRYFFDDAAQTISLEVQDKTDSIKSAVQQTWFPEDPNRCFGVGIKVQPVGTNSSNGTDSLLLTAIITPNNYNAGIELSWSNGSLDAQQYVTSDQLTTLSVSAVADNGCYASASIGGLRNNDTKTRQTWQFTPAASQVTFGQLSGVTIRWVDPQGTVWRSDIQPQPQTSIFNVSDRKSYLTNENGEQTSLLTFNTICWLFNTNGASRRFEGNGVIGVAIP